MLLDSRKAEIPRPSGILGVWKSEVYRKAMIMRNMGLIYRSGCMQSTESGLALPINYLHIIV